MTDNEIIKALECCCDKDKCNQCPVAVDCWFFCEKGYVDAPPVLSQVLDLINRQKAEIERLTKENEMVVYTKSNGWGHISFLEFIKNQRAEAIKEFAERLCEGRVSNDPVVTAVRCELKEMVGDDSNVPIVDKQN